MAIEDCPSPPLVPKRKRTERRPSASSDSVPTEDEIVCIHALLALSRAPAIHDEGMAPAEEERSPLSKSEMEQQNQLLPLSSSSPPKQQQELPPISLSSLEQQEQLLSSPPMADRDISPLPLPSSSPPKEHREVAPSSPPSLSPQDQPAPLPPRENQPPPPEEALSQVLCPAPIRCYQPPLPPPPTSAQRPSPIVAPAPTQQNQSCHECSECGKMFPSYQALGGHKTSHRKRPAESRVAASAAAAIEATNQDKPHACPLCHKSFPTGQALGGHMRAHYEGNKQQATAERRAVAAPPSSSLMELGIDLNEPPTQEPDWAMVEEAASSQPAAATTSQRPPFLSFI